MNITMREALEKVASPLEIVQEETKKIYIKNFDLFTDFIAFQGHFPAQAVLPAIVQIMMAQNILAEIVQKDVCIQEVINAKFSSPIEPNQRVQAHISQVKEKMWQCQIYSLKDENTAEISAQFRLLCDK